MNAGRKPDARAARLRALLSEVRSRTEQLCAPLAIEDYVVQSMPDASPAKWHLAHTTWFFETFVLQAHVPGQRAYRAGWDYLFNSYYEAIGPRHLRAARGLLTRPTVAEVYAYRKAIDEQLAALLASEGVQQRGEVLDLIELGLHHEQQHQELILTDLQHALGENPLRPAYRQGPPPGAEAVDDARYIAHDGGVCMIGHTGAGFAFGGMRNRRCGYPTAGARCRRTAGTRRSTGSSATARGFASRSTGWCRSTRARRSATSASTRPMRSPAGRASACRPKRSGR
jgi:hypothetical protein